MYSVAAVQMTSGSNVGINLILAKKLLLRAVESGAKFIAGGSYEKLKGSCSKGWFIKPSIIENLNRNSDCYKEEAFGPVVSIHKFKNKKEGIRLANETNYGLSASIWTSDMIKANWIVRKIKAGRFWINSEQVNFPELPVGGTGISGIGREAGLQGIFAYTEIKSVIYNEQWGNDTLVRRNYFAYTELVYWYV